VGSTATALSGTPGMIVVGITAGYVTNFVQADGLYSWAAACLVAGAFLTWLMWAGPSVWRGSFYGPRWPDRGTAQARGPK
jgi:hypothetical protein